ncbi:MAG: hypothetical protein KDA96_03465, partial [Planctomycetaceae bacterium]|nr:hypothetical protein [Planctomycetaceae bacterium]
MQIADWIVVGAYAVGMLLVGWYYSRRTSTTDDYLLGGRNMSPWKVGLSLFATLLSTLTFLAIPGEMIKFGPMVLAQLPAAPFVIAVVGWILIPVIMRQRVTSAYEILETRLGLSVRLTGSSFFLIMRLFWMALVIFATADKVLVPIMGLDRSAVPWICLVMGILTIGYTSLGGIRAVVATDVIQTLILFTGAGLVLVLITVRLGGVSAWWPQAWPEEWQRPVFWIDSGSRFTFVGGFLSMFTWYVCTAGADQMAIQRYLATRDAPAARRMFSVSLITNVVLWPFLGAVGLALLAWFQAHPEMLTKNEPVEEQVEKQQTEARSMADPADPPQLAGMSVRENADELLPLFIVKGLPAGISGLVVAGLLAAAMSSLSSGLNSACSVVTTDFIERFLSRPDQPQMTDRARVLRAQLVSIIIGAIVILLGTVVGQVEGNLLELCFKIANLLVAPLFLLFFMALFVP